jgi:ribosomal protein L40E
MVFCGSCGAENAGSAKHCVKCGRSLDMTPKPGMCVECGSMNAIGMTQCGNCGAKLKVVVPREEVSGTQPGQSVSPAPPAKECIWCGNVVSGKGEVCLECQKRKGDAKTRRRFNKRMKPSPRLTLAAAYLVLSGTAAFLWGLLLLFIESLIVEFSGVGTGVGTCGVIFMLLGMGSVAGGVLAASRRQLMLVAVGGICSFLCVTLIVLTLIGLIGAVIIGVPFGLIGPWLLAGARNEFD